MFIHLERWRRAWPYLLFLALILFSLRDVLTLPGVIGHSWDWDISSSPEQIWGRLTHDFFVWDYELRGGYYSPFRTGGLFSLFALPFSLLGGILYSRLFIILPMFLSAICMRRFASEVLKLNAWWSTIAGALYMLSPVVYSRILAGHNLLLPYAFFPLLYVYLHRTVEGCASGRFALWDALIAGLLLGIQAIHASMMVLAFVVAVLVFLFALVQSTQRRRVFLGAAVIFVIFGLLNAYWALPVGIGYMTSGTLFHSGSAVDSPSQATASNVMSQRQNLFLETMQPLAQSLRMDSFPGYGPEFVYPVPDILSVPWLFVSYLLPITAFAVLLKPKPQGTTIILVIAGLAGATLASGTTVPVGGWISQWLMLHVFPVWAEFGNAVRALPLVAFALCALVPSTLQRLSARPGAAAPVAVGAAMAVAIYVSPFLAGRTFFDSRYPQSLKSYRPSVQDQQAYEFLKEDLGDFRVSYIPPPWLYYAELYDLGYEWLGGLSPHPEFFVPYINPTAWQTPSQLQVDGQASSTGKLLGLAAVKYLVYPRERFVNPSLGLFPSSNTALVADSSRARLVDQTLESQKNLTRVTAPFSGTLILRNDSYLPRIYAASQASLIQGGSDQLANVASSSFFTGAPALLFDQQQEPTEGRRLARLADQMVQTERSAPSNWADPADTRLYYLLPFSPLGESTRTFTAARQGSYAFQVRTFPFQLLPAGQKDVSSVTFGAIESNELAAVKADLLYDLSLAQGTRSLLVTAYFPAERSNDQYMELDQRVEPINLVDFPNLSINSQVDNTGNQSLAVVLHMDIEGDEREDVTWTSPPFSHGKFKTDNLNVLQAVQSEFPGKDHYQVVGVGLRFRRNSQPEWDRAVYPAGLYDYQIQELGLYSSSSKPGWIWQPPSNLANGETTTLSRSIGSLDPSRFPLQLEYEADGPATLYVDAQLIARNEKGEQKAFPVLGQLVAPFSHSKMTIDARDMLMSANAESRWNVDRVELVAHRLRSRPELRPTTLRLLRVGGRWDADRDSSAPEPPVLTLDGKPIAIETSAPDLDQFIYSSAQVPLSSGEHNLSVGFSTPASAYSVASVEIVPWPEKTERIQPPNLAFESINPTRWRVHVSNAQAPYFMVFSETFDPGWRAYVVPHTQSKVDNAYSQKWYEQSALLTWLLDGANESEIRDHFLVNGFANSWYVEQTGDYDIIVEFAPQRMYEGGWIVSLFTLAAGGVFLLVRPRR